MLVVQLSLVFFIFTAALVRSDNIPERADGIKIFDSVPSPSSGESLEIEQYSLQNVKYYNLTTVVNKPARLPCFVERGRKSIWMKSDRNEILTVDNILITADKRFSIEQSPECFEKVIKSNNNNNNQESRSSSKLNNIDNQIQSDLNVGTLGCWVHLLIQSVSIEDEGMYVCQIDTMTSTRILVDVLVPPYLNRKLITTPSLDGGNLDSSSYEDATNQIIDSNIDLVEGSSVELVCGASGKPEPTVKWYSYDYDTSNSVYIKTSQILKLDGLSRNWNKKFECIAENGVNPSLSRSFIINIQVPPLIKEFKIHNCSTSIMSELNVRLDMSCEAESHPPPLFEWFYNGTELNEKSMRLFKYFSFSLNLFSDKKYNYISTLTMKNFSKSLIVDLFECRVRNKVGMDQSMGPPVCSEELAPSSSAPHAKLNHKQQGKLNHKKTHNGVPHKSIFNAKDSVSNDRKRTILDQKNSMKRNMTFHQLKMDLLSRQQRLGNSGLRVIMFPSSAYLVFCLIYILII